MKVNESRIVMVIVVVIFGIDFMRMLRKILLIINRRINGLVRLMSVCLMYLMIIRRLLLVGVVVVVEILG